MHLSSSPWKLKVQDSFTILYSVFLKILMAGQGLQAKSSMIGPPKSSEAFGPRLALHRAMLAAAAARQRLMPCLMVSWHERTEQLSFRWMLFWGSTHNTSFIPFNKVKQVSSHARLFFGALPHVVQRVSSSAPRSRAPPPRSGTEAFPWQTGLLGDQRVPELIGFLRAARCRRRGAARPEARFSRLESVAGQSTPRSPEGFTYLGVEALTVYALAV